MKAISTTMAAAAALIGLAACDRLGPSAGTASNDKAGAAPANKAGDANRAAGKAVDGLGAAAAPQQRGLAGNPNAIQASSALTLPVVDRAFLIGRWTDARDCGRAGEFTADGRFTNAAGDVAAWVLEGESLTMTFAGAAPRTVRVSALDQNSLNVVNPEGSIGRSTRC